jgi:hypothetical protein
MHRYLIVPPSTRGGGPNRFRGRERVESRSVLNHGHLALLVERIGRRLPGFQDRPDLHASSPCPRECRGKLQSFVEILGIDEREAAQALLRLGERAVGDRQLAVADAHGRGGTARLETRCRDVMPPFLQFFDPANARPNQRIHFALRQGGELFFLVVAQAKKSHGDLLIGVRTQWQRAIVVRRNVGSTMAR